jgi:transposase
MENNTPLSHRDIPNSVSPTPADASPSRHVMLRETQVKALEWLTNGGSITEAAQYVGVARQTVSRWLKEDEDFRAIYDAWRDQIMTMTDGQLSALAESAVATITEAVRDHSDVRAAQFVIKHLSAAAKRR